MAKSIKGTREGMVAIGVDLADVWSDWVGLDDRGDVIGRDRVKTTESELRKLFGAMAPTKPGQRRRRIWGMGTVH